MTFEQAAAMEKAGNIKGAEAAYRELASGGQVDARVLINLGTLCYSRGEATEALTYYRAAVSTDDKNSLAHFDLANALDETGDHERSFQHYHRALELAPDYADAHYNLALLYEKLREPRKALAHWRRYMKLDPSGPWNGRATNQFKRILKYDPLQIVVRNPEPARTKYRANLTLVRITDTGNLVP